MRIGKFSMDDRTAIIITLVIVGGVVALNGKEQVGAAIAGLAAFVWLFG